jgi:hypothetical protein
LRASPPTSAAAGVRRGRFALTEALDPVTSFHIFQDCPGFRIALALTKASAQAALAEASPILKASAGGPAARSNAGIGGVVNELGKSVPTLDVFQQSEI